MKHGVTAILPVSMICILLISCSGSQDESRSLEQIYAESGLPVRVEILQMSPPPAAYQTTAVLTGLEESTASASVADQVDRIHYKVGDTIQKDDVVMTFPMDNPAAHYMQAKVNVEHMRTTLDRMKNLYESGGISRQDLDNTAAQCKVAEADWDAARQAVQVRAPISGIITRMDVRQSDNVNPGDALFTVARISHLKAQLWVPESRIHDIHPGDKAVAAWNGLEISGRVHQVDISLNTEMQAFGVQIEFSNPDRAIRPGINADIRIIPARTGLILKTGRKNLVRKGDQTFAYRFAGQKAAKQPVVTGRNFDLDVEIVRGLSAGDTIITEGVNLVKDGQQVRIIPE